MAHWSEAVVTNSGVEMLNEWMAGRKLTVTSVYGGTGVVDADKLTEQAGLANVKYKLVLLGEEDDGTGVVVQVQVNNREVNEEYELNQVGVYAKLDAERDPDAEERLLFIMQDRKGVIIPAADEEVYLLELYCAIGITNNGRFTVSVDDTGIATVNSVREAIAEHDADTNAHASNAAVGAVKKDTEAILAELRGQRPKRYGFRVKISESDPAARVEYLYDAVGMTPAFMDYTAGAFNYGSWGNIWFIRDNYPCMVRYDGMEDYRLNPNDYSKKLTDGSASDVANTDYGGNAMTAIPCCWVKRWEEDGYRYVVICETQYDEGYKAYAHTRKDGSIEKIHYYPIFKGCMVDNKLRSLSGQYPQYNTTAQAERDAAKANGDKWDLRTWAMDELIADLLTLMSKTTQSQTAFGQGQTTGYVNNANQHYGHILSGTLNDKGGFFGYNDTTHAVKVFHMENFWSGRWDREVGLLYINGVYHAKMTPEGGGYNFTGTGYTPVCAGISGAGYREGWQKDTVQTEYGCFPTGVTGSDVTFECDYHWFNNGIVAVSLRGGRCNDGSKCGARCLCVNDAASRAFWNIGGSLSCESSS